jgi:Lrp/AsnC family transcriptional regulator for asnA, asnC and gidA
MFDELNIKIINLLEQNGRMAFTKIAERLGVSESTVRKRVTGLVDQGVITFSISIDPKQLDMKAIAYVGVDVTPQKLLEIAEVLCGYPEVKTVATSVGDHMIMTEIWERDARAMEKFIEEEISSLEGVTNVCPALILEKMKSCYQVK